jgi:hypothetical protein
MAESKIAHLHERRRRSRYYLMLAVKDDEALTTKLAILWHACLIVYEAINAMRQLTLLTHFSG